MLHNIREFLFIVVLVWMNFGGLLLVMDENIRRKVFGILYLMGGFGAMLNAIAIAGNHGFMPVLNWGASLEPDGIHVMASASTRFVSLCDRFGIPGVWQFSFGDVFLYASFLGFLGITLAEKIWKLRGKKLWQE